MMKDKPVQVLLVDDDEVDVMAVKRAFGQAKITNDLFIASDGVEALEMLRGEHEDGIHIKQPYIILLDLNMPRMGGLEFLDTIRRDDDLKRAVVFVLTTSDDERDIGAAYDAQVAGYIVKSRVSENFEELLRILEPYWEFVELPDA